MRHHDTQRALPILWLVGLVTAVTATAGGTNMSANVRCEGHKVWIEGVDTYRYMDPMYEGIRIILMARGAAYSPAYIQGISGSAFRIGGICPCAPTCANWIEPGDFIGRLGYEVARVPLAGKDAELAAAATQAVARVRQEIDAGRAALVWHAFTTAEFDVVFGYDSASGEFLGRGSYAGNDKPYAKARATRMSACGDICPPVGAILIGNKTGALDATAAELAALREAVRHARTPPATKPDGKWAMFEGLACYDRWVEDFRKNPTRMPDGSQYCYGVVRSTHRAADAFLREIAPKYPAAQASLVVAATCFAREADILDAAEPLLGWKAPKELTPGHCRQVADALQRARDEYAAGVAGVEAALAALPAAANPAEGTAVQPDGLRELAARRFMDGLPTNTLYNPAGVPLAHVQALNHAGTKISYAEFAAGCGWAFSFGYQYGDISPSILDVAGRPNQDGPREVFRWLTERLGYRCDGVPTRNAAKFREFVTRHGAAGNPILVDQMDGGLICGHRTVSNRFEVLFQGTVGSGWLAELQGPTWAYVLTRVGEPVAPRQLTLDALRRALDKATQAQAALDAYAADVADPAKDFEKCQEYFCWSTFERLGARKCAAVWLRSIAETVGGDACPNLQAAAECYDRAYDAYTRFYQACGGGARTGQSFRERFRSPERIAAMMPPLREGLAAERAAVEAMRLAVPAGPVKPSARVVLQPVDDAFTQAVKARRSMNHARTELVCRLALLHAQGAKDVTYEDLVMAAGWGTSFVFHEKKGWLIFTPPDDPKAIEDRLTQAAGWRWQSLGDYKGKPDEAWAALAKSIDAGRGVVGVFLDDYIFAGYEDAGRKEDRRVYHLGGWDPNGWWTWAEFEKWCGDWGRLNAYGEKSPRGDAHEALLTAMRGAVKCATGDGRKSVPKFADGAYGLAGMEAYAAAVADSSRDPDWSEGGWLGCFCINRQHDARDAAARWFSARAGLLAEPARGHLLKAAAHYEAACSAWGDFEAVLGRGAGKTELEDLKGLWRDASARKAGAEAVRRAAEFERQAVSEIEKALAGLRTEAKAP